MLRLHSIIVTVLYITLATINHESATAYKILLYPDNVKSHFGYFGEMARALLERNHEVHMTVPSNTQLPPGQHPGLKVLPFQVFDIHFFQYCLEFAMYVSKVLMRIHVHV